MGRFRRLLLLLLLSLPLLFPAGDSDLVSDRAALLAFRDAVNGRTEIWNASADACQWPGVRCEAGNVTVLRLPAYALTGTVPVGTIGNLTRLRTLSLRFNALSGPLPPDLSRLTLLRNLYLQGNLFSGQIPQSLFAIHGLVRLDLAGNNFSGKISPEFSNLTRLRTLYLEKNAFVGSLPDLNLPNLEEFNVSNNRLNGSVPEMLSKLPAASFLGNDLCGLPLSLCADSSPSPMTSPAPGTSPAFGVVVNNKHDKRKISGAAVAGIVIGSVLGFLLILLVVFFLCRSKSSTKTRSLEMSAVKHGGGGLESPAEKRTGETDNNVFSSGHAATAGAGGSGKAEAANVGGKKLLFFGDAAPIFDLEDLLRASAEVLGKGVFGTAYKAVLEVGMTVAVKRLRDVTISEREFKENIELVGSMNHQNLVPLMAYYYSADEKLLVYDYLPTGSLSALLHGNRGAGRTPLNWELRSSIALGAARGIAYLHARGPNISHGSIKSSNILLSKSHEARVSDFGLAYLVGPPSSPTRVAGYRAPEVTDPRKVSQKADVYSFGILLLELLTGKAPTHALLNEEGVDLPRWVQSVVREEWTSEVFDLELLRDQNVEGEMVQLLQLAIDCADQFPDKRPQMADVIVQIEELCRSSLRDYQEIQNPQTDSFDLEDSTR